MKSSWKLRLTHFEVLPAGVAQLQRLSRSLGDQPWQGSHEAGRHRRRARDDGASPGVAGGTLRVS